MSRIQAIKIKPTDLTAKAKVVAKNIERYQLFQSTNKDGEAYEEDRIYFIHDGLPHYMSMNNKTLIFLAQHGISVKLEDLIAGSLNGCTIYFKIVKNQGPYAHYVPEKLVKPK